MCRRLPIHTTSFPTASGRWQQWLSGNGITDGGHLRRPWDRAARQKRSGANAGEPSLQSTTQDGPDNRTRPVFQIAPTSLTRGAQRPSSLALRRCKRDRSDYPSARVRPPVFFLLSFCCGKVGGPSAASPTIGFRRVLVGLASLGPPYILRPFFVPRFLPSSPVLLPDCELCRESQHEENQPRPAQQTGKNKGRSPNIPMEQGNDRNASQRQVAQGEGIE